MNTLNGYSKSVLTDNYVLTAAGGHFPLDNTGGEALGSNTYIATLATNKSIIVEGNADTYYPVRIYMPTTKLDSTRISIWKNLSSQTASYTGNHSNGTSSLWLIYEGRNTSWDGNGGFIKTWYKSEPYAKLVAHAEINTNRIGDLIVWLRGGGTLYNIACSKYCNVTVYLEETNVYSESYPIILSPKTTIENGGIISNFLGYGNVSSASILQTARTIWGQSFNGSANITGVFTTNSNVVLKSSTDNGETPHLLFQRGTTSNEYYDWEMYNTSGYLKTRYNNNGTWNEILSLYPSNCTLEGSKILTAGNSSVSGTDTSITVKINNVTKSLTVPESLPANGGKSDYIKIHDIRNAESFAPNSSIYPEKTLTAWFSMNSVPTSGWYSGITVKGWTNNYQSWQLASWSNESAKEKLYYRRGGGGSANAETWGDWKEIAFKSDIPTSLPASSVGLNSEFYAPVTAGTNGQILLSTGEVPTWVNPDTLTGGAGIIYIEGTGTTAGTWLGTHDKITSYYKGLTIAYKIPIAGASTTTLNINNLGAITVKRNTSNLTTHIPVNSVIVLVYDGTNFMWSDYDSTDTSTLRLYYQRFKAGTNGIKQYSLILKDADGNWQSLTTTSGTIATKTVNNAKFDLSDLCHLYYASNNITSGGTTTVGYIYKIYSLADIRYSTNYTTTAGMTVDKMVYIVGTIDNEGYFRLDENWYTQTLEEAVDKVYIPIGYAYDTYRIMFNGFLKPICYRNRSFVEYDPCKMHRINIGDSAYYPTYGIVTLPSSYPANGGTADKLGSTTMGSTTQPIYLNNGTPTLCTSYSALLTALTNDNNQISLTVGGTTKKLTVNYANNSGISDNALLFQDMSTLPVANDNMPWEKIVMVDNKGVSDIGTELRFNYDNDATSGGTVLICTGQYQNTVLLPDKDGTIALIEDLQGLGGTTSGYWANVPISSTSSTATTPTFSNTVTGSLVVNPNQTTYREGIRIGSTSSKWSLLMLLGPDTTAVGTSTSAKTWGFFNNDGKFYLNKNGSNTLNSNTIHNTDGTWKIGTSSNTSAKLTVYGEIDATNGFFETSDSRLKNFLNEIQIDFDKLSQLPKMYFTWKADEKEMPDLQIGTSAQELQKIYPELVGEVDGHLTVAYDKLSIIALKAIDELYTMNVELKKQNAKLKSKVDRLERRVYYGKKY